MVASTTLRERGFAETKRLCYAGLDVPTLLREVAGGLGRVVPIEAYCVTSNDPLSGLLTHMAGQGPVNDKVHFRIYLEHIYFEEDLDAQRRMVRNRSPVALLSEVTRTRIETISGDTSSSPVGDIVCKVHPCPPVGSLV
jgi:hypothetical protein